MSEENRVTGIVVDTAIAIHRDLGPGLLESVYEKVLAHELERRRLGVETQKSIAICYDSLEIQDAFRADLVIDNKVIVELKSVEKLLQVHSKQLLTYLRLTNMKVGLLLNFGESLMKNGVHRVVNGLSD